MGKSVIEMAREIVAKFTKEPVPNDTPMQVRAEDLYEASAALIAYHEAVEACAKVAKLGWVSADYDTVGIVDADKAMALCEHIEADIRALARPDPEPAVLAATDAQSSGSADREDAEAVGSGPDDDVSPAMQEAIDKTRDDIKAAFAPARLMEGEPLRCEVTGNPVGTDTWGNGGECQCGPCQKYVSAMAFNPFKATAPTPASGQDGERVSEAMVEAAMGAWHDYPPVHKPGIGPVVRANDAMRAALTAALAAKGR